MHSLFDPSRSNRYTFRLVLLLVALVCLAGRTQAAVSISNILPTTLPPGGSHGGYIAVTATVTGVDRTLPRIIFYNPDGTLDGYGPYMGNLSGDTYEADVMVPINYSNSHTGIQIAVSLGDVISDRVLQGFDATPPVISEVTPTVLPVGGGQIQVKADVADPAPSAGSSLPEVYIYRPSENFTYRSYMVYSGSYPHCISEYLQVYAGDQVSIHATDYAGNVAVYNIGTVPADTTPPVGFGFSALPSKSSVGPDDPTMVTGMISGYVMDPMPGTGLQYTGSYTVRDSASLSQTGGSFSINPADGSYQLSVPIDTSLPGTSRSRHYDITLTVSDRAGNTLQIPVSADIRSVNFGGRPGRPFEIRTRSVVLGHRG